MQLLIFNIEIMKKKFKPLFTVNITNCNDDRDIVVEFTKAKVRAGLPITEYEFNTCISHTISMFEDALNSMSFELEVPDVPDMILVKKKPNIFKRFWNWITRKK